MPKTMDYRHMYCLFCKSGAEAQIASKIERQQAIRALVAIQEKHKLIQRKQAIDRRVFLPGYLFLYTNEKICFDEILKIDDVYRVLGGRGESAELRGYDRAFAQWLCQNDGTIGISKIRMAGGELRVSSGPMRFFLRKIIKIDKHTKNALVRMDFLGRELDMWLAFDFDDVI